MKLVIVSSHQTIKNIRLTIIPKPAINMALALPVFIEIAPFRVLPEPEIEDADGLAPEPDAVVVFVPFRLAN